MSRTQCPCPALCAVTLLIFVWSLFPSLTSFHLVQSLSCDLLAFLSTCVYVLRGGYIVGVVDGSGFVSDTVCLTFFSLLASLSLRYLSLAASSSTGCITFSVLVCSVYFVMCALMVREPDSVSVPDFVVTLSTCCQPSLPLFLVFI